MTNFLHHFLSINILTTVYWDCIIHGQQQQCGIQIHDLDGRSYRLGKKYSHLFEADKEFEQLLGHGLLITIFFGVKNNCDIPQTQMFLPWLLVIVSTVSYIQVLSESLFLGLPVFSLPPVLSPISVPFNMFWKHVCAWRSSSSFRYLQKHLLRPNFSYVSVGLWFGCFAMCLSCYTAVR